MPHPTSLQISPARSDPPLSPAQKRFNSLIRQIEQARQTLAAWQANIPVYREADHAVLRPLDDQVLAATRQWILALDELLGRKDWSKVDRGTLRDVLREEAARWLQGDASDAEIRAVYDKHAEVDFATSQRKALLAMKDLAESATGLDLGDDDDLQTEAELHARWAQAEEQEAAARAAPKGSRRKGAGQLRREAEKQEAAQSMREIFRKLASALHPDRERDEQQRVEKTALMQRVNQAYAANDLLALLELQLQIEQIDASHIAGASAARLTHYNKVLAEQLSELRMEIGRVETAWCMEFGMNELRLGRNPRQLTRIFEDCCHRSRAELAGYQRDLRMLDDIAATRRWLKVLRRRLRESESEFDLTF